ncbi:MAG TPA: SDR family NAD(P)-dependent oxidoreductase [Spirochaetia bacterium]|nr:SDR family NAD(P)-dependent oxidoreductase [Spirochaetia bacterium]
MDIKGKVIIVTGASNGIGLAAARLLSQHGARLALVARSSDKLREIAKGMPESFPFTADMTKESNIRAMVDAVVKHFGRIDVLINNAGQGLYGPIEATDLAQYRSIMELNVFGPVAAMQAVIPVMRKQGGGLILNVSSAVSKMYIPHLGAYASTKYALNAVSLTSRQELAADNIRVGIMLPGMTATDFGKNALGTRPQGSLRPAAAQGSSAPPMPRTETAEEVAQKILEALISEEAEVLANSIARR